jgi:hypothetical protein
MVICIWIEVSRRTLFLPRYVSTVSHGCHGIHGEGGYVMTTYEKVSVVLTIIGLLLSAYKLVKKKD